MSTETAHLATQIVNPLVAHVPVDNFDIVNGPTPAAFAEIINTLLQQVVHGEQGQPRGVEVTFTLKTVASSQEFKRSMKVFSFGEAINGEISFTAVFSARIVSGVYHMGNRTGYFNLD